MQARKALPNLEELRKHLSYDPTTGLFTKSNGKVYGKTINTRNYTTIHIKGRTYYGHILAWYLYYGKAPREGYPIDHINGIASDNRIENLRELNEAQNAKSKHGTRFFFDGIVV